MKTGLNILNSIEVAQMFGVNVSTIKRWTQEGKLPCHKTAGGHRKFLMPHLVDFVKQYTGKIPAINLLSIENEKDLVVNYHTMKGDYDFLKDHIMEEALSSKRERIQQVLNGLYMSRHPLYDIYENLLTPVLHELGKKWQAGELSVVETHVASQTIRDCIIRLQGIIRIPKNKIGRVLLINLSSELHDIALKMVDHILEERGFHIYFSGQMTPLLKTEHIFEKVRPERLYISCTVVLDKKQSQDEVNQLLTLAQQYNTKVYTGGQGFEGLDYTQVVGATRIDSFEQVSKI